MRARHRAVLTASVTFSLLAVGAPAAMGSGGEVEGEGSHYHLTNGWEGRTDRAFSYGRANDTLYIGDWNGTGNDTLAVRRDATYHFSNRLTGGEADRVVTYG